MEKGQGEEGTEQPLRLRDVFERIEIDPYDLNLDKLAVMADGGTFQRFDKFNLKYNPCGDSLLRTIFLKTDNHLGGRYLAELTKELFADLEETKYQLSEYRLSIYGRKPTEWRKLAQWVMGHGLVSSYNKWMIQIPRIFNVYATLGMLENFEQMIDNIFRPLFEVSCNPDSDPLLHQFLSHVSGLDSVDDESKLGLDKPDVLPADWTMKENPSYRYYSYYIWANLRALNHLRKSRGMNTFTFRPHAGEAGSIDNLDNTFLLADSINHGINLKLSPVLQYLYYLGQIGLAVSPLSNNLLFVDYAKNPFFSLFARGLNVSLSTDDPLMFHQTKEPLMEEYSIAKQVWRLSSADLCELARMSVLQSGFDTECKERWLGSADPDVNVIAKTNVPHTRMRFRQRLFAEEAKLLLSDGVLGSTSPTLLGQYNARMLLSPSASRGRTLTRNSEVMRQERMNTLAVCECHPNGGLKPPPLLDLAASAVGAKQNGAPRQYSAPGVLRGTAASVGHGDGSDDDIVRDVSDSMMLLEQELKHGQSPLAEDESMIEMRVLPGSSGWGEEGGGNTAAAGVRRVESGTANGEGAAAMREVAMTLARLQTEMAELKTATSLAVRVPPQMPQQPSESFVARLRGWWVALGWQGRGVTALAVALWWLAGWRRRPRQVLAAAVAGK